MPHVGRSEGGAVPFFDLETGEPYQPVLRQINPREFCLERGFRYRSDGYDFTVGANQGPTDLTSVPWFLRWFIGKYGKHTNAALLHDHLLAHAVVERTEADLVFRHALAELEVGLVHRSVMWAAVTLGTRLASRRWIVKLTMAAWLAAMLSGVLTLILGVATVNWGVILFAAVAPNLGAFLWLDQWRAGWWAGYGVGIVGVPSLAIALFMGLYVVAETVARGIGKLVRRPQPPPTRPSAI